MSARSNGPGSFNIEGNYGSATAKAFAERHRQLFVDLMAAVDGYAREGDGCGLLLLDSALLGAAQRGRDHMSRLGITVQALPPAVGDELSNKMQLKQ